MTEFPGRLPGLAEEKWSDQVTELLQSTLAPVGKMEGGGSGSRRRPLAILAVILVVERSVLTWRRLQSFQS